MNSHSYKYYALTALKRRWFIPILMTIGLLWMIFLIFSINLGLYIFSITGLVIGFMLLLYQSMALMIIKHQDCSLYAIWKCFKYHNASAFALGLLTYMFQMLWSIFFIIPGVLKMYDHALIYYVLIDNPSLSPIDIISRSKEMMKGKRWRLFKLDMSFIGWYLLSLLTGGLLLFFVLPYHQVARAAFYEDIRYKPERTC